jgi:hypothetical protein
MPNEDQVLIAGLRAKRRRVARVLIEELRALRKEPVREDVLYDEHGQPRL